MPERTKPCRAVGVEEIGVGEVQPEVQRRYDAATPSKKRRWTIRYFSLYRQDRRSQVFTVVGDA